MDKHPLGEKMTKICPDCKEKNEAESVYCIKCGKNIERVPVINIEEPFVEKNKLPLIIIGTTALLVMLFLAISPSEISNGQVFHLEGEPTQSADVDGVFIKIPQAFIIDPTSIDFDYQNFVMSSSKQWSHENEHIALMVMRSSYPNVDVNQAIGANGGEQRNMYGYNGYYIEHESGYSFAFVKDNKICVIMVSSPYLFDKITIG